MERRKFITNIGLGSFALFSWTPLIFAGHNERQYSSNENHPLGWSSTAMTIVKIGLSASEIFKGASSEDISEIQINMLENISNQIEVVQDGINAIILEIDTVKKLIGDIPQQVVQELLQKKLQGNITSFDELMKTYSNYRRLKNGNKKFLLEKSPEVKALIASIRENRNILINYDNYLNVPLISTALYMEYNCMQLIGENKQSINPIIETYRDYFKNTLYGENSENLKNIIDTIRTERLLHIRNANKSEYFETKIKRHSSNAKLFWIRIGMASFNSEIDFNYEKDNVKSLVELGLINNSERLNKVTFETKSKVPETATGYTHDGDFRTNISKTINFKSHRDFLNDKERARSILEENIKLTTLKLYVAVSCLHAGNRALNFCNYF